MLFNILVKNTDDHLRNHGFLLYEDGWELSPAFDINPNHSGNGLTLNISQEDNSLDTGLALSVAKHFRLKAEEAQSILDHLLKVVSGWEDVAAKYGLTRRERETMAAAFHKG
jgi:serine/threonine-protein kinase HipA